MFCTCTDIVCVISDWLVNDAVVEPTTHITQHVLPLVLYLPPPDDDCELSQRQLVGHKKLGPVQQGKAAFVLSTLHYDLQTHVKQSVQQAHGNGYTIINTSPTDTSRKTYIAKRSSMIYTHRDFALKSVFDGDDFMPPVVYGMDREILHISKFAVIMSTGVHHAPRITSPQTPSNRSRVTV